MPVVEETRPAVQDQTPTADLILGRAEAWMREHGWTRGRMENETGAVCLIGALRRGVERYPPSPARADAFGAAWTRVYMVINVGPMASLPDWNDNICQSETEALEVLVRARTV